MEFGLHGASENSSTKIYSFGGLNRTRKGNRNEFSDMRNMTAEEYPCASPCGEKQKIATAGEINAVCAPDATNVSEVTGITGVCDGGFYYNGVLKSEGYKLSSEWSWQIEQKGNTYIINGYDSANKKSILYYYNIDTDVFAEGGKVMRNLIVQSYSNYLVTLSDDDYGTDSYECTTSDGVVIKNSDFWKTYKEYTTDAADYTTTLSSDENIFEQYFEVGDEITIEGFPGTGNDGQIWNISTSSGVLPQPGIGADRNNTVDTDNMTTTDSLSKHSICTARIKSFRIKTVADGKAYHYVYFDLLNKNGESVEFRDMYSGGYYCSGVTLKKRTRVLDNITTHHGRIWGSSPSGNQIYSSASDDIFSFSAEDITKRYAARIPSDTPGVFTALCSFNNDLIAFKPDSITVISGTNPTNYSSFVIGGIGCIAPDSVAVTPDGVIFLGYNGFYIYDGSVPRCISTKVNTRYKNAVSGFDGNSYYASAVTKSGVCEFLVYNTDYAMWHIRDGMNARGFFRFLDGFYVADESSLFKMDAQLPDSWSFTLIPAYDNKFDNKGINEIWVRAEVTDGAWFMLETAVDGGEFKTHSVFSKAGTRFYRCPVRFENGEYYSVKISGNGKVVIYELEIRKSDGGRRYKEY